MERLHRNPEEERAESAGVHGREPDRARVAPAVARGNRCRR